MQSSVIPARPLFTTAGLFAGIGGVELGLHRAGAATVMLCENWEPARAVLREHFPDVPIAGDIRTLEALPTVDVVAAGFPCTDLSQAGRTAGIHGDQSGLVSHLFRLLRSSQPRWVVVENVRNMLALDQGRAMTYLTVELERLQYQWAYRLVDSRFTGTPQRRQRVILVASQDADPRAVLFADDEGEPKSGYFGDEAYGFYWTEGLRGLGWARDAIPTLKGGSTIGIPSPPAIWIREAPTGSAIVTPDVTAGERLQGFATDWTLPAATLKRGTGARWKLVGNAVTVGVAEWLGGRLAAPGTYDAVDFTPQSRDQKWPTAAYGARGNRWQAHVSMWPRRCEYHHLLDVVDAAKTTPLSSRASEGFLSRMEQSTLNFDEAFKLAVKRHVEVMSTDR